MKTPSSNLLKFLEQKKIDYTIIGNVLERYTIASVFKPIENGLYFFTGTILPKKIINSLIICNKDLSESISNSRIIVDNPQKVFYEYINFKYAKKSNGIISDTVKIDKGSKIGDNVQIDDFCIIGNCKIGDNTIIGSHSTVHDNSIVGKECFIDSYSSIGASGIAWIWDEINDDRILLPQLGDVIIKDRCILGSNTIIVKGSLNESTYIGKGTVVAPGSRIGHGTQIGDYVHLANNVVTGGNTNIGDYSFIGSSATFRPKVKIHQKTIVGAGSVVVKNTTKEGVTLMGVPAKEVVSKKHPSGMPKPKK